MTASHHYLINLFITLTGVAQLIGHCLTNCKVASSIPSQGTCLCCRPGFQLSMYEKQLMDVPLPLFRPPFPLSKNK